MFQGFPEVVHCHYFCLFPLTDDLVLKPQSFISIYRWCFFHGVVFIFTEVSVTRQSSWADNFIYKELVKVCRWLRRAWWLCLTAKLSGKWILIIAYAFTGHYLSSLQYAVTLVKICCKNGSRRNQWFFVYI